MGLWDKAKKLGKKATTPFTRLAKGDVVGALEATPAGAIVKSAYNKAYGDSHKPVDSSQLTEDRGRALGMYEQFMGDMKNRPDAPADITASQEAAAPTIEAADAGPIERVGAQEADIAQSDASERVKFSLDPSVERARTREVDVPQMGPAAQASWQGAEAYDARASQIDGSQMMESRNLQKEQAGNLQAVIEGKAPSVAEAQYNRALTGLAREQMGMAAQARGTERAGARREAMLAMGQQGADAAMAGAQLRAQESAAARSQLGELATGMRAGDAQTAITAAQMGTDVSKFNAGQRTDVSKFAAGAANQASQFNAGQSNQMTQAQGQLTAEVTQGNANRDVNVQQGNAAASNQRATDIAQGNLTANTGNANRAQENSQFNAGQRQQGSQFNAGQRQDAATTNAGAYNTGAQNQANRQTDVNVQNASNTIGVSSRNTDRTQQAATTNQSTQSTTRGQDIQREAGIRGDAISASGQAQDATTAGMEQANKDKDRRAGFGDKLFKAASDAGMAAISDKRAKENIKELKPDAALSQALKMYEFEYKGDKSNGKHVGHMAQDLEKHPATAKHVLNGDDGVKRVDYGGLTNMLLLEALKAKKGRA